MSCNHNEQCDHQDPSSLLPYTLFSQINTPAIRCLNIVDEESGKEVFKCWNDRFDATKFVLSEADDSMIIHVPFISSLKLKSIMVLGEGGEMDPREMKVFVNRLCIRINDRDDVDFDSVEDIICTQEWMLLENAEGMIPEYQTKTTSFTNVRSITMYFTSSFGGEKCKITYIGLKGEFTAINRDPVVTLYEVASNPADHKLKGASEEMGRSIL